MQPAVDGRLRVVLQGGFDLARNGRSVAIPHSSQRVVAFLALQGRPLRRAAVAASLWGEATTDRAGAALRTALWRLRTSVGSPPIVSHGHDLALRDDIEIDARLTARRAEEIRNGHAAAVGFGEVVALRDAADLLADWYDDWAIVERERFRQLRVEALEWICCELSAIGRYAEATEAGLAAVAADPLRESAHHALIAAHLREGNRRDALRQYELLRDLLRRDLALDPSPAVRESVAPLLR